jgi:hypothetical protein
LRSGFRQRLEGKDREIRAEDFAEMAVDTVIFSFSLRVIIAFEIEGLRHAEDMARAVRDTELAALAPLFDDRDPTLRDLNGLQIKWNTPILHFQSPPACQPEYHPGRGKIFPNIPTGMC